MLRFFVLVALAPLLTAAAKSATPPTVTVALVSYRFAPNPIRLAAGKPVRLYFYNQSGKAHDFTAKDFFQRSKILAGFAPGGEIELEGRRGATVTLVPTAGVYKAHCSHFMHKPLGMVATIIVE